MNEQDKRATLKLDPRVMRFVELSSMHESAMQGKRIMDIILDFVPFDEMREEIDELKDKIYDEE